MAREVYEVTGGGRHAVVKPLTTETLRPPKKDEDVKLIPAKTVADVEESTRLDIFSIESQGGGEIDLKSMKTNTLLNRLGRNGGPRDNDSLAKHLNELASRWASLTDKERIEILVIFSKYYEKTEDLQRAITCIEMIERTPTLLAAFDNPAALTSILARLRAKKQLSESGTAVDMNNYSSKVLWPNGQLIEKLKSETDPAERFKILKALSRRDFRQVGFRRRVLLRLSEEYQARDLYPEAIAVMETLIHDKPESQPLDIGRVKSLRSKMKKAGQS